MPEKVGELNGKWSILFRAQLAVGAIVLPLIIAWCTWATVEVFKVQTDLKVFMAAGPRYTPADARSEILKMKEEILNEVEQNYPPEWLKEQLRELKDLVRRVDIRVNQHSEREK
jgi:hypothetical protein